MPLILQPKALMPIRAIVSIYMVAFSLFTGMAWGQSCEDAIRFTRPYRAGYWLGKSKVVTARFLRETRETRGKNIDYGARLFFKPVEKAPNPQSYLGFLTPRSQFFGDDGLTLTILKSIYQAVPSRVVGLIRGMFWGGATWSVYGLVHGDPIYAVTPGSGYQYLLNRAVYSSSKWMGFRRQFVATIGLSIGIVGGSTMAVHSAFIDPFVKQHVQAVVDGGIEKNLSVHRGYFRTLVESDMRYDELKTVYKEELKTVESEGERQELENEVLSDAVILYQSHRRFTETFKPQDFVPTLVSIQDLVQSPQFDHLRTRVPKVEAEVQKDVWQSIVWINWMYHTTSQAIPEFIGQTDSFKKALEHQGVRELLEPAFEHPFAKRVESLVRARRLTDSQAVRILSFWLTYRTRVAESKAFGDTAAKFEKIEIVEKDLLAGK